MITSAHYDDVPMKRARELHGLPWVCGSTGAGCGSRRVESAQGSAGIMGKTVCSTRRQGVDYAPVQNVYTLNPLLKVDFRDTNAA